MMTNIDWVDVAINKYLAGRLARFRARLEQEAEQPVGDLEVNAALLLSDLCRFLGLDEPQYVYVLGERGVEYVLRVMEAHCSVRANRVTTRSRPASETVEVVATSPLLGGSR